MNVEHVGPVHYRFSTQYTSFGIDVMEERWFVLRETEHGFWIVPDWSCAGERTFEEDLYGLRRFVFKNSRRSYAHPNRDHAWASFCIRRRKYERHLAFRALANRQLVENLPADAPPVVMAGDGVLCSDPDLVVRAVIPEELLVSERKLMFLLGKKVNDER